HTSFSRDCNSDVCSSDLIVLPSRPLLKKAVVTVSPRSEAGKWFNTKKPQNQPFSIMLLDDEKDIKNEQEETNETVADATVETPRSEERRGGKEGIDNLRR